MEPVKEWMPKAIKAFRERKAAEVKADPHIRVLTLLARSPEIRRGLTEYFREQHNSATIEQELAIRAGNPHLVGYTAGVAQALAAAMKWINTLSPEKES